MNRLASLVIIALTATSSLFAAKKETITLRTKNFSEIEASIPANIVVKENADSAGLIVYTIASEYKDLLEFKWSSNKLNCKIKKNTSVRNLRLNTITIYNNGSISKAKINGSGSLILTRAKIGKNLNLEINGSGDIVANNVGNVKGSVNGSGDITIKSVDASKANFNINGCGNIKVTGYLKAKDVEAAINGSGDISSATTQATNVTCSLNGSGNIIIKGICKTAKYSLVGSGNINCSNLKASKVDATSQSSGTIKCYASEEFIGNAKSNSGNIICNGKPTKTTISGRTNRIKIK